MSTETNVSGDLLWEIVRNNSSFIVKRKVGNNIIVFSRDPLNVTNKHTRKHSGLVNDKAIGLHPGPKGGVTLLTKKTNEKHAGKPASLINTVNFGVNKSSRKTAVGVVGFTAKKYYRPDLRKDAVARACAIKRSQLARKDRPASKPRGAKAKAAAASTEKA